MVRQYRAADVAACIINLACNMEKPVSNLKLQKLLFFCQCTSIQERGAVLFQDDIVAWQYGPVVKSVYNTYSYRGASAIRRAAKYVRDDRGVDRTPVVELDWPSFELVESVVKKWILRAAWDLVCKSHEPGGAWDRTYNADGTEGSGYGDVIPIDFMRHERLA